jgi:hypothetical protein
MGGWFVHANRAGSDNSEKRKIKSTVLHSSSGGTPYTAAPITARRERMPQLLYAWLASCSWLTINFIRSVRLWKSVRVPPNHENETRLLFSVFPCVSRVNMVDITLQPLSVWTWKWRGKSCLCEEMHPNRPYRSLSGAQWLAEISLRTRNQQTSVK